MKALWYVCDAPSWRSKGFCLYSDRTACKMEERLGLPRCVKHGSILEYDFRLDGKTRVEARRYIEQEMRDEKEYSEAMADQADARRY